MDTHIAVKESTVQSLQIIFAYQGQQLIRKIGQKKGWTEIEINSLIKEFINKDNLEINIVTDIQNRRGRKNVDLKPCDRCIALTANKEQCSRRRNTSNSNPKYKYYCGIHLRKVKSENGLCYGVISDSNIKENTDINSKSYIDTDVDINLDNVSNQDDLIEIGNPLLKIQNSDNDIEPSVFYPLGDNISDSDSDSDGITVSDIMIDGVKYLIDYKTYNIYSYDDEEHIGKYDKETKTIKLIR